MSSHEQIDPTTMAAAAARAIATIKYCWLITPSDTGATNARPMGVTPRAPDDDEWLVRFVTDGQSRKVAESQRGESVSLIFQRDEDDAYIALRGEIEVRGDACADPRLWRERYAAYFPGEGRERAAFFELRVNEMALWMRGVTPEPFGLRPTLLQRDATGAWRHIE